MHDTQWLGNVIPRAPFTSITFQWLLVGCRYMRPYTLPLWTTGLSGFAEASGIASGLQTRIGTSCGPPEKKTTKKVFLSAVVSETNGADPTSSYTRLRSFVRSTVLANSLRTTSDFRGRFISGDKNNKRLLACRKHGRMLRWRTIAAPRLNEERYLIFSVANV